MRSTMDDDRIDIQRYVDGSMRRIALTQGAVEDLPKIAARTIKTVERSRTLLARLNGHEQSHET